MSHVSWKGISEIGQLFFIVLDGSKVLIRDLLLDKNHCIYPHDPWVINSELT